MIIIASHHFQGSHFFYPVKFPDFSLTFPWFPKSFPWFFLSFHQDILVKKTYLFFLNVALVTLVYTNIASLSAISWQLPKKRFENGFEKKFPDLKFFPWFWLKTPCFSLISLTGKSLQNFPWSVGTLISFGRETKIKATLPEPTRQFQM